jgi:hypothetical protein
MTKPVKRMIEQIKEINEMYARQLELSDKYGGAWISVPMPFSHEVHFLMFENPSKVPDGYIKSNNPFHDTQIAYKGKLHEFSKSALIREQNRGMGGDR